jgi:formylglycine-generating enzyme required for sulfatase activity
MKNPSHEQRITSPYWIAQFPVTNAQWQQGVKAGVVQEPLTDQSRAWYNDSAMAAAPVVGVTWFMARDFAAWLGCRLPSELEWEYAARGVESLRYPWGNDWNPDIPVWDKNSSGHPAVVNTRPEGKSWVAAWHMIGNVWEWSSSLYEPYPYQAQDGRERDTGDSTDVWRVLRGGSWYDGNTNLLRSACRDLNTPVSRYNSRGSRLARS